MLDKSKVAIAEERNSSKAPMSEADVRKLLGQVETVVIAKGKASRTMKSKEASPDDLRGPTGNFRAPMLRVGKTLVVGFSPDELHRVLG